MWGVVSEQIMEMCRGSRPANGTRYVLDKDYLYSVLFYKSNFRVNTRAGCK